LIEKIFDKFVSAKASELGPAVKLVGTLLEEKFVSQDGFVEGYVFSLFKYLYSCFFPPSLLSPFPDPACNDETKILFIITFVLPSFSFSKKKKKICGVKFFLSSFACR